MVSQIALKGTWHSENVLDMWTRKTTRFTSVKRAFISNQEDIKD